MKTTTTTTTAPALLLSILLPAYALAAPAKAPAEKCQSVRAEDGSAIFAKRTKTGWSQVSCELQITVRLRAGLPPAKDTGIPHRAGKYYSLRKATSTACTVWVYDRPTAKSGADHILTAWDLCIDSMHAEAEKEVK